MYLDYSCWQRLEKVIKWSGLSIHAFANTIGLKSAENIYRIKNKKNGISRKMISTITKRFPMIDEKWILTGNGFMLVDTTVLLESSPNIIFFDDGYQSLIPPQKRESINFSLPFFKEDCVSFKIKGNDLSPKINEDDIILASKIDIDKFIFGDIYVITTDKKIFIKRVHEHKKDTEKLSLHCEFPQKNRPVNIHKKKITVAYKVCGIIRKL